VHSFASFHLGFSLFSLFPSLFSSFSLFRRLSGFLCRPLGGPKPSGRPFAHCESPFWQPPSADCVRQRSFSLALPAHSLHTVAGALAKLAQPSQWRTNRIKFEPNEMKRVQRLARLCALSTGLPQLGALPAALKSGEGRRARLGQSLGVGGSGSRAVAACLLAGLAS